MKVDRYYDSQSGLRGAKGLTLDLSIKMIGQKKAFCRHRIAESSCAREENVDIDILISSRNENLSE